MSIHRAAIFIPMLTTIQEEVNVSNCALDTLTTTQSPRFSEQQITLYPHQDENNNWRIIAVTPEGEHDADHATTPITHVTPNMQVRLEHVSTSKRLHSHEVRPPISDVDFQNEVSGYGFPGFVGDANDNWWVEIEEGDSKDGESWKRLKTLRTKFRLRHALTGCYLFSHKVKLPDWGFEQQEVTCNKNAVKANSLWFIETNTHPQRELRSILVFVNCVG
jgi:dolichyl-phosphate-mannose-protein mannosyltransferase